MHDLISIEDMRKLFLEKVQSAELKDFAHSQQTLIEDLMLRNKRLEEKLKHAESLLKGLQKNGVVLKVSPEEMICVEQIEVLKAKSSERELSTDEVKRLDLLIKNIKILREPQAKSETLDADNMSEDQLVGLIENN